MSTAATWYSEALVQLECSSGIDPVLVQQLSEQVQEINQSIAAYENGISAYVNKKFHELPQQLHEELRLIEQYSTKTYFQYVSKIIKQLDDKIGESYRQNKIDKALKYAYQRIRLFSKYAMGYPAEKSRGLLMDHLFIILYEQVDASVKQVYFKHWIHVVEQAFTTTAEFLETDAIKQDIYARVFHQLKSFFPTKEQFLQAKASSSSIQAITKLIRNYIEFFEVETCAPLFEDQRWFLAVIQDKNSSKVGFFSKESFEQDENAPISLMNRHHLFPNIHSISKP